MRIASLTLRRPVATVMVFIGLSLLGYISYTRLPVQLLPRYTYPTMSVMASWPGASPEKIERDIILPLEGEVSTLEGIEKLTSVSRRDSGTVTIAYKLDTDLKFAFVRLEQKVTAMKSRLPRNAFLTAVRTDTSMLTNIVLQFEVTGPQDTARLRHLADTRLRQALESVDGVSRVFVTGGNAPIITIEIDPDRCLAYGVSPADVIARIDAFHLKRKYLGEVAAGDRKMFVTLEGEATRLEDFRDVPVNSQGGATVADVADIRESLSSEDEIFRVNGRSAVGIYILKDDGANLVQVARKLRRRMDSINEETAPIGVRLQVGFDAAKMIEDQLREIKKRALAGLALAVLVLLLFLKNLRAVGVVLTAVPISILITFSLMSLAGMSINLLTLLGISLSIGMLVDNSIVVLESIFRHRERGEGLVEAVENGSAEVMRAIAASTATTVAVFVPLIWIKTAETPLFTDLALSVVFPLTVSLAVAIGLIPLLASWLLSGRVALAVSRGADRRPSRFGIVYMSLLKAACRHQLLTFLMFFGFLILTLLITMPFLVFLYVPERAPEDRIEMRLDLPKGTNLETTDRTIRRVEEMISGYKEIGESSVRIQPAQADFTIKRKEGPDTGARTLAAIREDLVKKTETMAGVTLDFDTTQFQRGTEGGGGDGGDGRDPFGLSGSVETVVLRGDDMGRLRDLADDVETRLKLIQGVNARRVKVSVGERQPEVRLIPDRVALALRNLDTTSLMALVWASRRQGEAARYPFRLQGEEYDVVLRLKGAEKMTLQDLKDLRLPGAGGGVPLQDVAQIRIDEDQGEIRRVEKQRELKVSYSLDTASRSRIAAIRRDVDDAVYRMRLPSGYSAEVKHEASDTRTYKWMAYLALLLLFMILAATFSSYHMPLLIMLTIPLAIIGVLWGLVLTGTNFEMIVFMGLLILLGVAVNNGILLVDYARYLTARGYSETRAVLAAGRARYRPVFMTAATTVLGLLPLAFASGEGNRIWPPFAIAVIGGLLFATLTTLIFIPMGMLAFRRVGVWLRWIGIPGTLLALAAGGGSVYIMGWRLLWITSTVWRWSWAVVIVVAWLGIASLARYLLKPLERHPLLGKPEYTIAVRRLTKVYGEPMPFIRDLQEWDRWVRHTLRSGGRVVDAKLLRRDLIWKVPFAGLLVALHFFFERGFSRFVLSWASFFFFINLLAVLRVLADPERFADADRVAFSRDRRVDAAIRFGAALAMAVHVHFWLKLSPTFSLIVMPLAFLLAYALYAGRRLRLREVTVAAARPAVLRWWYTLIAMVPSLGTPRDKVRALWRVDLDFSTGMVGLLGPNGAGKTTLIRTVCNVLQPSRGRVFLNGFDMQKERETVQSLVGYLPQDFGLYDTLTAREFLRYFAFLNGIWDRARRNDLVERILADVGLAERAGDRIGTYSGGMRQRCGIARTLLHLPRIIVVDEPTVGLDPKERVRFRNLLSELAKDRVVIFSTHIVEDIAGTCRVLAVLDQGEVKYWGPPDGMLAMARGRVFEASLTEERFERERPALTVISQIREDGGQVRVRYIGEARTDLESEQVEPTLEDAYVCLVGREK